MNQEEKANPMRIQSWMMPKNLSCIQEADEYNEDRTESVINKSQFQFGQGEQSKVGSQFERGRLSPTRGGFDTSYDLSPPRDSNVQRFTAKNLMNDSWNANNISRITGAKMDMSTSGFVDDAKMMEMLQNENLFEEIDMGQIDEEDRQFLLVDKDTGRVYDMRNETHLARLQEKQTRLTTDLNTSTQNGTGGKAWSDWWKLKRNNNQEFLQAAESGSLEEVHKLLDKTIHQDLVADLNTKGLDQWTALHFAASEGRVEVVKELISRPEIEKEPQSSINRTPLHLACMRGHTAIVRVLINAGSDKNSKDFDEYTPLHFASEFGHFETIIYLVKEAEANPMLKNKFGYTPSDIAQNMQIRKLFESLLP